MSEFGRPEHVYVENEWYDGPRSGVADIDGQPHRFVSQYDETDDEYLGNFLVWPVDAAELALEKEQWLIFVVWNEEYEAGRAGVESHPGNPGTSRRWDEIQSLLQATRTSVPATARRARVQMVPVEREHRYEESGPPYKLAWQLS